MAYADTAGAAAYVKEMDDPKACAIAPPIAAELYGLKIVARRCRRCGRQHHPLRGAGARSRSIRRRWPATPAMTTFVFEVKNIPAALYKALGGFATNGVNMTKLESYQKGASFAATMFYADIIGRPGDAAVDRALEELAFHCKELRLLGTYRQARERG